MTYQVGGAFVTRCEASSFYGVRCVLLRQHGVASGTRHATMTGRLFEEPGGKYVDLPARAAGQPFDQWAHEQGMAPATSVPSGCYATGCARPSGHWGNHRDVAGGVWPNNPPADPFASAAGEVWPPNRSLNPVADLETDVHNQRLAQSAILGMLNTLRQEHEELKKVVIEDGQLLATTRNELDNRLVRLNGRLGAVEADRLDLSHRLTKLDERVAGKPDEAPTSWDADSAEPPRNGQYRDAKGVLWSREANGNGAGWVYSYGGPNDAGPFYAWGELTGEHKVMADFPWVRVR